MPTGYTADIAEGKEQTFEQFVWGCARAFGALVLMRDEPSNAPIPKRFEPSRYNAEAADKARAKLLKLEAMGPDETRFAAKAEWDEAYRAREQRIQDRRARRARYEAMLTQVRAWQPPSPDHVGLKEFMVDQLMKSIDFDCSDAYDDLPKPLRGDEWREAKIAKLRTDIDYHNAEQAKENARTEDRNQWLAALRDSLAKPITA